MASQSGVLTLVQTARLMQDVRDKAITMALAAKSNVLQDLPIRTIGSMRYQFYRAVTLQNLPQWTNLNADPAVTYNDIEHQSVAMYGLADKKKIDIALEKDKFITNPMALQIELTMQGLGYQFANAFINGDPNAQANLDGNGNPASTFPGLRYRLDVNHQAEFGISSDCLIDGGGVDLSALDPPATNSRQFLNLMDRSLAVVGAGDTANVVCYMPRDLWVRLPAIMRASGTFAITKDSFGRRVYDYGGVPIRDMGLVTPSKVLGMSTPAGSLNSVIGRETSAGVRDDTTPGSYTSMYFVKLGEQNMHGVQQAPPYQADLGISRENGIFRNWVFRWFVGLVNRQPWDVVRVYDIKVA